MEIHPEFRDYSLTGEVFHEAGFDAIMTGVSWFKLMSLFNKNRIFPGVPAVMANEQYNLMDKNKIPMASIRTSFNLNP